MPKIHRCLQGTTEWLNLRAGIPTASEFDKIVTPSGKPSTSAEKYLFALLAERIMGRPRIEAVSTWMNRGQEMEEEAVNFYELTRDAETEIVGFITNDACTAGASPDRLVGEEGLLEIKVPAEHTHVSYLLKKAVDQAYYPQVQGQLWISERKWADILSYHPEMPPALIRVERDEKFIALLAAAVGEFSKLLENYSRDLVGRGWIKAWPIPLEIRVAPESEEYLPAEIDPGPLSFSSAPPPQTGIGDLEQGGMVGPDYSKDPPPPCPKCGGPTVFKQAGRFKKTKWPDGWKCNEKPKNCKQRGVKGAWITANDWHKELAELQSNITSSATTKAVTATASPAIKPPDTLFQDEPGSDG